MRDDLISVIYPAVRDGKVVPISEDVPRSEVLRRLDGCSAIQPLRDDPRIVVLALVDPTLLTSWLSREEMIALVRASSG